MLTATGFSTVSAIANKTGANLLYKSTVNYQLNDFGNWNGTPQDTVSIAITGFSANEGNTGTTIRKFNLNLSAASTLPVTVAFTTADGTATAGSDYQATSGTVTFAPGERLKPVEVTIIGDLTEEASETVILKLSNPTNANLSSDSSVATIINDDSTGDVELTPAVTEGPYFNEYSDAAHNRSDVTSNTSRPSVLNGKPLEITVNVFEVDGSDVTPLENARVDIWQTDAIGKYSDEAVEGTSGQTFLRGYQFTKGGGDVDFTTIFPGWYHDRTAHIHFMARTESSGGELMNRLTSQFFFKDSLTDSVYSHSPYNTRGTRDTTNQDDFVYQQYDDNGDVVGDFLVLELTPDGSGYKATFNVYVASV